jgi:hypothetical protein
MPVRAGILSLVALDHGASLQQESIDAMRVTVVTAKTTVKDEIGRKVEGVVLTCSRCGKTVEVFGTSDASVRRGFVKLREGCEEKTNFYVEEELQRETRSGPIVSD